MRFPRPFGWNGQPPRFPIPFGLNGQMPQSIDSFQSNFNQHLFNIHTERFFSKQNENKKRKKMEKKRRRKIAKAKAEKKENNGIDHIARTKVIHEGIIEVYQSRVNKDSYSTFPMSLFNIIEGYDYSKQSFDELYDNVADELIESEQERESLDFYSPSFIKDIHSLLVKKKVGRSNIIFWNSLSRLVFKWMVYMRRKIIKNSEFEDLIKTDIIPISKTLDLVGSFVFPIKFDFRANFISEIFETFMNYEISDASFEIFPLFHSIIKKFYTDYNGKRELTCRDLEIEYWNGNIESNPLLTFMILKYEKLGILREICFSNGKINSKELSKISTVKVASFLGSEEFENLNLEGPEDFTISDMSYITNFTIETFLRIKKKFLISKSHDLGLLVDKLSEMKPPIKEESFSKIIKFHFGNEREAYWDKGLFKSHMRVYKANKIMDSKKKLKKESDEMDCEEDFD